MNNNLRILDNAICEGGLASVALLLDESFIDVNAHYQHNNETALHIAAQKGQTAVAEFLINKGANVDACKKLNQTALHLAVQEGHKALVELLIEKGADVNSMSVFSTPLLLAAGESYIKIAELLISAGADVNRPNQEGDTPLSQAAVSGAHIEMVRLLIEKGAEVNKINKKGNSPLSLAAGKGYIEMVRLLIEKGAEVDKDNLMSSWSSTPLSSAARENHTEVAKFLIHKGANVNKEHLINGDTPLVCAVHEDCREMVKLLIDNGADVNKGNLEGNTPLSYAALWNHIEMAELLIDNGADVNKGNLEGNTPLLVAARRCHVVMVSKLVRLGADVNALTGLDNTTPLLYQVIHDFKSDLDREDKKWIIELLVSKGARLDIKDKRTKKNVYDLLLGLPSDFQDNIHQYHHATIVSRQVFYYFPIMPEVYDLLGHEEELSPPMRLHKALWALQKDRVCLELLIHPLGIESLGDKGSHCVSRLTAELASTSDVVKRQSLEQLRVLVQKVIVRLPNELQASIVAHIMQGRMYDKYQEVLAVDDIAKIRARFSGLSQFLQAMKQIDAQAAPEMVDKNLKEAVDSFEQKRESIISCRLPLFPHQSLLHWAVKQQHGAMIQWLILQGVDINSKDAQRNTPLHIAAQRGKEDLYDRLVEAGAREDQLNYLGMTAPALLSESLKVEQAVNPLLSLKR